MTIYRRMLLAIALPALFLSTETFAAKKLRFSTYEDAGSTLVVEPIIREAYKRLGYAIEIHELPGQRAINYANKGEYDGELGRLAVVQEMYPNLIKVPTPIHEEREVVFTNNADFIPQGWESLRPYTAVSILGYKRTERKLKENGVRYHLVSTFEQVLRTVSLGRYDIGLLSLSDGLKVMQSKNIKGVRILHPPIETFPIYHFLHKKNHTLVSKVSEKLKELQEERYSEKINAYVTSYVLTD